MNVLDLFSGIGGFSIGLERAGMRTVAFCEIDPYCRAVLRKHWPDVPVFGDVKTLTAEALADAGYHEPSGRNEASQGQQLGSGRTARSEPASCGIDLICGGFPCQDISIAGKGAGIEGSRSGLWSEYARIIGEVRPRYVIVENVAALLHRGIERVLGDLAALGYDAEWHCVPASAVGAPHRRDRVWIVAYAKESRRAGLCEGESPDFGRRRRSGNSSSTADLAHADEPRLEGRIGAGLSERLGQCAAWSRDPSTYDTQRESESWVGRVANGIPFRVDRLRALGNAIVPQIAEIIGKAIMEIEQS